jgi:hypothetical protein
MKLNELQFQGVSQNLKYIFTDRGMIPLVEYFKNQKTPNFISYSYDNLDLAVDLMKEHNELFYKSNKISLVEYTSSSRKFLHNLIEIFQPQNSVSIISEWEEKIGSKLLIINESMDSLIVEQRVDNSWNSLKVLIEQWYNPLSKDFAVYQGAKKAYNWGKEQVKGVYDWTKEQSKQIKDKGLWQWAKDKASAVWESVKSAVSAAWKCLTNNFVECLMEGIRKASFSAVGMGVMTAITFIPGVGQVADFVVFGSLLIWDVYKMMSGKYESGEYKWSYMDIIIDAICILIPTLGGALKAGVKGLKAPITSAAELGTVAAKQGGIFAKIVGLLKGGVSKIVGFIGRAAEWIGEKLGLTWLKNFGTKAQSFMTTTVETSVKTAEGQGANLAKAAEGGTVAAQKPSLLSKAKTKGAEAIQKGKQFAKDFKFTKPTPVVLKATGKTIMITAALCAALGVDGWTCHHKVENGEITPEQIAQAEKAIKSDKFGQQLGQLSVQDAESIGLI